ncbi:MAG: WYL domain-containing protein, partial [Caldilineaceae bacterium]|nr:WYL domain-containing protein [Caldilineaceae bacterium]
DLKAYSGRSFGVYQEDPFKAVWKFDAEVADDVRDHLFHLTQVLEEQPDGSIIVSFEAAGWKEMCWHLFTWGGKVEVIEPILLREKYNDLLLDIIKKSKKIGVNYNEKGCLSRLRQSTPISRSLLYYH